MQKGDIFDVFKDYKFLLLVFALTSTMIPLYFTESTLPLMLQKNHDNAQYIFGTIVTITTLMSIILQIFISKFSKRFGYIKSIILGQFLTILVFIVIPILKNDISLIGIFMILSIGEMLTSLSSNLLIVDNCKEGNIGKYMSIGKLRVFLALSISAAIGGYFINNNAIQMCMLTYSGLSLFGIVTLFLLKNSINDTSRK